jgi:hypothetical protein
MGGGGSYIFGYSFAIDPRTGTGTSCKEEQAFFAVDEIGFIRTP